jgi:hypothetical protein
MTAIVEIVNTAKLPNHQIAIRIAATTSIGRILIPVNLPDSGSQADNEAQACRVALAAVDSIATELRRQLRWER